MTAAPVPPPPPAIVALQGDTVASDAVGQPETGGFVGHLVDAIGVNADRARIYARQSQGRSWPLSLRLIAAETLLIPSAWVFDLWGGSFHGRGLPAVTGDFTSMQAIAPADRPAKPFRQPKPVVWSDLGEQIAFYGGVIRTATEARDFALVCQACDALLDAVDRLQARHALPMPMTRHVVESLGYAAVHALEYGQASQGETDGLYAAFLGFQAMGITAGVDLDRAALPVHAEGIGILVNDLPQIPFREAWQAYRRANGGG